MATQNAFSVVEFYFNEDSSEHKCGYCKKRNAYKRHGLWAHRLTVRDYQNLIDRGWRRSGCYCYKPTNDQTCCPLYTIKCEALDFMLSKSQKKIIKRVAKFIKEGKKEEAYDKKTHKRTKIHHDSLNDIVEPDYSEHMARAHANLSENEIMMRETECDKKLSSSPQDKIQSESEDIIENTPAQPMIQDIESLSNESKKSLTQNKPSNTSTMSVSDSDLPKKAKLMRIERARNRLLAKGKTIEEIELIYKKKKEKNKPKSLDELLNSLTDGVNKLELKLVPVSSEEFMATVDESAELFKKYQIAVHNDDPFDCDKKSFLNFLGKSPLHHWKPESGPPLGYGSFHQQYRLNNKLMAVGVIDILPYCVSSVYFFYDPVYSFLSLGTYSSLMEVRLVRELNKTVPDLKYYYMGYYIHSIPKMRYKAKMRPSKLLCPETYKWFDIERCLPKLNENEYSRLNEDIDAIDEDGVIGFETLLKVPVYYRGRMLYQNVREIRRKFDDKKDDINEVKEYAEVVGKKCALNMYLVRT
ncbi:arginyl-tRNA--protein transferase 1 [Chelonus insularis]|uniref:arginyl-tRNA--protein transferase 1 n=1 Tax=Chelonus insularis TaxID=460826 RepID=UPI00158A2F14|nr:arginyl-tRNA--protein transferase 1 [Chelonus insularis]